MKKILSFALAAVIAAGTSAVSASVAKADSAVHLSGGILNDIVNVQSEYSISVGNTNRNSYPRNWANITYSYLTETQNGLMRVQADTVNRKILIEYFDYGGLKLKSSKTLDYELPLFGAFYDDGNYYYILSGQNNQSENNSTEVFRVTKFDTNWKRLGSASLCGENTTKPFEGGSARITHSGKYLLVRTCHEMYKSSDGLNHQANVTFEVNTDTMTVTDKVTGIYNNSMGYVSHSFNQYILIDGNNIVGVDHGDAHPRSVALLKYNTDMTDGKFAPPWVAGTKEACDKVDMLPISGTTGDNYTGVQVGGFEMSNTCYIVAGTTVDQSKSSSKTANVFVSTLGKTLNGNPTVTGITNYPEGSASAANPHLVNVGDGFMLLWQRKGESDVTYYTFLDANGKRTCDIIPITANLSDCKPIVSGNRVVWYTSQGKSITFYSMSCDPNDARNIKIGDADGDGSVKLNDVITVLQHVIGKRTLSGYPLRNADVNGDGQVNVADASALLKLYVNS